MPVEEMDKRLAYQDMPAFLNPYERILAEGDPLFLSRSDKVVTISHHLAHAYSAFAACPFDEGVVMVVDGVGSYRSDVPGANSSRPTERPSARARVGELLPLSRLEIETLKKVWMEPSRGFLSDEFYNMDGLGALYSRASTYVFGDWNKCGELMGLAPYGRPGPLKPMMDIENGELKVPELDRSVRPKLLSARRRREMGKQSLDGAVGGPGLANSG